MTAPAVRSAVYLVFATRWIVQWTIWAVLALIGLSAIYIAGALVYTAQPWYDTDVIRQLGSGPHSTPWNDVSDRAVELFPDGMSIRAAIALLQKNGFSCTQPPEPSAAESFTCHRTTNILMCKSDYDVDLRLDASQNIVGRKAKFYYVCP